MQELSEADQALGLLITTPVDTEDGTLSALSIPSPGGFFSALEPSSRHTWIASPAEPSTSIAERFYGVPWQGSTTDLGIHTSSNQASPRGRFSPSMQRFPPIIKHSIVIPADDDENLTEGPPTARRIPLNSPKNSIIVNDEAPKLTAVEDKSEYDEGYVRDLHAKSVASLDRTSSWLQEQVTYTSTAKASPPAKASPRQRSLSDSESVTASDKGSNSGSSHKSVRFADVEPSTSPEAVSPQSPQQKDSSFVREFQRLSRHSQKADAFVHRKTRTDALRLDRSCLFSSHVDQLESKYEIPVSKTADPKRSGAFFDADVDEQNEERTMIAQAQKEQKAFEQIKSCSWNLEATKYLNGGSLLMSPTGKTFQRVQKGKVLDLGGQATCDWAWQVAIEHPSTIVHTVYTTEQQTVDKSIEGPANHKQKAVPNLWTLPYPNNYFHLVSARNLCQHLRTTLPPTQLADEYDLCLKEALRVLQPGGYLEFSLLDADILNPGPVAQAMSVEFCFNLKTRGYDPAPTKTWLPRLRKAGFGDVRRAWLVMPMPQVWEDEERDPAATVGGNTSDASYISGMVGSWAWERWMLKLNREMGKAEDKLLDGVPAALEEGAHCGASWRYLSGWARKPKY